MKIFDMPRNTGKTFQLAMLSEKTGYPVLVATVTEKLDLERKFPDSKFISVSELQKPGARVPEHIYIDEVFWVLRNLLPHEVTVEGVSFSSEQEAYEQYRKWDREKSKDYYL